MGRESELAVIDAFLRDGEAGLQTLLIVGEAGIGKSTLWQEAARLARERGLVVLAARPAETEASLAFTGLADLLAGVGADVFERLPPPQRRALDVALLRAEADPSPGRRLVGTALYSVLSLLASAGPILLALDDAQWLDPPSSGALEFALRRLGDAQVRVLLSIRASAAQPVFVSALDDRAMRDVVLGPLSVGALQRIIADRLGVTFPRPTLVKLATASNGNAFYALEIARLLSSRTAVETSTRLPVPDDLRALVEARIARLPHTTRDALLRASALARPTSALVDVAALEPAEEAELVTTHIDGAIHFTHPLFASAVYGSASARDRSRAHRELAAAVGDPEERAHHLALAATSPDEVTAAALVEAAGQARARGAPDSAVELAQLAVRLTPSGSERTDERRFALAEHLLIAGNAPRAAEVLEKLTATVDGGELRVRALLMLADIEYWQAGESAAVRVGEAALAAATDPLLRARCLAQIAMHAGTSDLPRAAESARESLMLLEGQPGADPSIVSLALSARVRADLFLGRGLDRDAAERASALETQATSLPPAVDTRIDFKLGQWLRYVDDFAGSRRSLLAAEHAASEEGDESSLANILLNRTLLECWSGDWETAADLADQTQLLFALTGVPAESSSIWRAYVDAHFGRTEAVRAAAARAIDTGEPVVRMLWQRTLGLAELAAGDAAAADRHFAEAVAALETMGFLEPAVWRIDGDAIEAAVGSDNLDRAEALLARFEPAAERSAIPWSLAVSARCRALVLAARGETRKASGVLADALAAHERSPVPFEHARTLLVHGQVLRRLKQKREARHSLDRAVAIFGDLGAARWVARAHDELKRTTTRAAPDDLSETELRIARLAASGMTNDAIAADAFVSRKTVEANLSRAYRKLGIRSRAQLARALDARDEAAIS